MQTSRAASGIAVPAVLIAWCHTVGALIRELRRTGGWQSSGPIEIGTFSCKNTGRP